MQNTLGQVSSMTSGGMPSSWAESAASEANDNYMQQLTNEIPALKQAAYGMYQDNLTNQNNALSALEGADNNAYSQFSNDRSYNTGVDQFNQNLTEQQKQDATAANEYQQTQAQNESQFNATQNQNQSQFNTQESDSKTAAATSSAAATAAAQAATYSNYLKSLTSYRDATTAGYTKAGLPTGTTSTHSASDVINYVFNLPIDDNTASSLLADLGYDQSHISYDKSTGLYVYK